MTETEHLIRQAARELQIPLADIAVTSAEPDLKTMEVVNTYTVHFNDRHGNPAKVEIKDNTPFPAIHAALKTAYKAKKNEA